jgi:hypothetical protein
MPVAGGNVECFRLRIYHGCLIENGISRFPAERAIKDVDVAVEALQRGEAIYLQAYGSNLADVRKKLRESGIVV